jgi:hypothetical protein
VSSAPSSDAGFGNLWGCPSCGAAQYCSNVCADAAKPVHNVNCWHLQALAPDGVCWMQPASIAPAVAGLAHCGI